MPNRPKRSKSFRNVRLETQVTEERATHLRRLPASKRPRLMQDFSPDELAALTVKLKEWTRTHAGRGSGVPMAAEALGHL